MKTTKRPKLKRCKRIAITLGDPLGVGPEIIFKSLTNFNKECQVIVIGEYSHYPHPVQIIDSLSDDLENNVYFFPVKSVKGSDPSFEYVKTAVHMALENQIDAVVTGPISKENWQKAGIHYNGHTGYLAEMAGCNRYAMFFWSQDLKVALYTIHIPLASVFERIKKVEIVSYIKFLNKELLRLFGKDFVFLVSGLNPHAGEGGYLGREEMDEIIPAIEELNCHMDIQGPFPPDSIFIKAREIEHSVVISWYHDQGLIPFKLLNIHSGVNLTLGLPFVRTSPDHGTAFDIAGKNIANPSSMKEAIKLAGELIGVR